MGSVVTMNGTMPRQLMKYVTYWKKMMRSEMDTSLCWSSRDPR